MHWQLHLATQPLRHVYLLDGEPTQVAVSDSRERIRFYDLASGAHYGDLKIDLDLLDNDVLSERQEGLDALKAPNGVYLPLVELNASRLYASQDGKLRLIHDVDAGLSLEMDEAIIPLDSMGDKAVTHAALERELGTIAAITEDRRLHVFQQQIPIGSSALEEKNILYLFAIAAGSRIVIISPQSFRVVDTSGKTLYHQAVHYPISAATVSPNGRWLAVADADYGVIRLYNHELLPIRQQHAQDLLAGAAQLQLFASAPSLNAPIVAMDIANDGMLAFVMGGSLCVASASLMTELPQPRRLL